MTPRSLFRVGLKVVGAAFLVSGVANIGGIAAVVVASYWSEYRAAYYGLNGGNHWSDWINVARECRPLIELLVGAYLFFGGRWVVNLAFPSASGCAECGYMLEGIEGSRCPECNTPFRAEAVTPPGDDA